MSENKHMSESIAEITKVLAKAKSEFTAILKNKQVSVKLKSGGEYKFDYADLDCVFSAVNPSLHSNGLVVTQLVHGAHIISVLSHESGEYIQSFTPINRGNLTAQEYGSEITYLKRYAFCALVGVTAEDDDDGNAASGNTSKKTKDEKPWYNDFDKDKSKMQSMVDDGKRMPDEILLNLKKSYRVSRAVSDAILNFKGS